MSVFESPCKPRQSFFVSTEPRYYKEVYRTDKKINQMHSARDLLYHYSGPTDQQKAPESPLKESDLNEKVKCASRARYGSALKPRHTQTTWFDQSFVDRHERMNTVEKRKRMS